MVPTIPRRVLMTADTVGGVWTYALELVRALAPSGVRVVLATMGAPLSETQQKQVKTLDNLDVVESAYKLEWQHDPWHDVQRAGDWLLRLEREVRPDLVHLNGYAHGSLPFVAPKLVVAHSCVLSWFRAVKNADAPSPEFDRYRREVTRGLRAADLVIAPSRAMAEAVDHHYGVSASVIYNARETSHFQPNSKEPVILAVGRLWDEAKNVNALAEVAPQLPAPVYVAGETRSPDGESHKLANVHALGMLSHHELAAWMGRAAIYALPAKYEPFGLSVLEAALSGCALVLGDIPSLREIWGDAALFVAPDDRRALSAALRKLLADPAQHAHLGERARAHALTFTPARMASGYLAAYSSLLGSRTPFGEAHARRDVLSLDTL